MRRILAIVMMLIILTGCKKSNGTEPALALRDKILQSEGCRFTVVIDADYGETLYSFTMDCISDQSGNVTFTVVKPDTIRGITGKVDSEGGSITFDDKVLSFPLLADEQLTPVSTPWLLLRTLRSGYISGGGKDGDYYKVIIDDTYENEVLKTQVWLDDQNMPIHCDFLWKNRRILTAKVENFAIV